MPIAELENQTRTKTKKPSMFACILFNDDLTPFEFVEMVLSEVFKKSGADVMKITQEAHNSGKALIGVYTKEVAVSRCAIAVQIARSSGFPLKVVAREAE